MGHAGTGWSHTEVAKVTGEGAKVQQDYWREGPDVRSLNLK